MQLPTGYLQLKLILQSHENAVRNSNMQRNYIMKKSFTHCTIDLMSFVILICNEKLLLLGLSKISTDKRLFANMVGKLRQPPIT